MIQIWKTDICKSDKFGLQIDENFTKIWFEIEWSKRRDLNIVNQILGSSIFKFATVYINFLFEPQKKRKLKDGMQSIFRHTELNHLSLSRHWFKHPDDQKSLENNKAKPSKKIALLKDRLQSLAEVVVEWAYSDDTTTKHTQFTERWLAEPFKNQNNPLMDVYVWETLQKNK